jgi:hypothetical protein
LTVVVLLSLGKNPHREYKIAFAEDETIDENAEAIKLQLPLVKYTSEFIWAATLRVIMLFECRLLYKKAKP